MGAGIYCTLGMLQFSFPDADADAGQGINPHGAKHIPIYEAYSFVYIVHANLKYTCIIV